MTLYEFLRDTFVKPWFLVTARPWLEGEENIPETGPVILASNHQSAVETVLLPAMVKRQMSFAAKQELFTGKGIHRLLGIFLKAVGIQPLDRTGGRASANSMEAVSGVLADGGVLGIFPEGTRSPDGRLHKGKTGTARLVLAAGVPVVPVAMINTVGVKVKGWPFKRMRNPGIRFGPALDFTQWRAGAGNRDVIRYVTDEVMAAIQDLSGQEYVDVYAASLRQAKAEGRELTATVLPRPGHGRPIPPLPVASDESAPAFPPTNDADVVGLVEAVDEVAPPVTEPEETT
ncbi:lysophospholipid acyltransferase family protein [Propionibacteriaceae bacterium Y1685]|uniref:lysophospholipid acyltransferase family protein n=1 Tax=Microlunatus sp. Y1700 TaxID=3418487 RepID=UPI003B7CBA7A